MKLIKRNNYPAYILDNIDRTVLEDDNGNPIMVSHFFDQQELGSRIKKWQKKMTYTLEMHHYVECYPYDFYTIEQMRLKYHQ